MAPQEQRLVERLAERTEWLCSMPSPIGEERALCDALALWAAGEGLGATRHGNALLVPGSRPLALVGHLDTVPRLEGDPAPGETRRSGNRLHGKGASDMKGGLAVAMEVFLTLPEALRPHLIFYDREEGPYAENGLEPLFARKLIPKLELAVCLEPTDNTLQLGCVGSLHATVRFRGRAAHSARPWEGENAVHAAGALLTRLAALEPRAVTHGELTFYQVTQVTKASGGSARNVVPDLFELNVNHRFAPGVSIAQAKADLHALVHTAGAAESPGSEAPTLEFTDLSPSGPTCEHNPAVQALRGLGLATLAKQAWTDVARFGVHGIDAVNFGPGQTAQAHQVDEWCDLDALAAAHGTLTTWLSA